MAIYTEEQVIQVLRDNLFLDIEHIGTTRVEIRLMSRNTPDMALEIAKKTGGLVTDIYEIDSVEIDLDG